MFPFTLFLLILGVICTVTDGSCGSSNCSDLSCKCKPKILYEMAGAPCCCNCKDDNCRKCGCRKKRFYVDIYAKLNVFEAFEYCRYKGMMLASIDSKEENDRLLDLSIDLEVQPGGLWLSGSDVAQEGRFIWASNGKPLVYKNFMPQQPDNAGGVEDCIMFGINGKWNDDNCEGKKLFVCEYYE